MKKFFPALVLFLIIFSYSFLLNSNFVFAGECDNCICHEPGGSGQKELGPKASKDQCGADCKGKSGYDNSGTSFTCVASSSGSSASGGPSGQVTLTDPLNINSADPQKFLARIISALLGFVGVAALLAFVYAGFMFLISTGNQEQVKKAKDTMLYAAIGAAIAMGSYAILSYVFKILETGTGN